MLAQVVIPGLGGTHTYPYTQQPVTEARSPKYGVSRGSYPRTQGRGAIHTYPRSLSFPSWLRNHFTFQATSHGNAVCLRASFPVFPKDTAT